MNLNSIESNIKKFNYRDLIIFLVPILIFFLYLFVYKPGILTAASFSQLHQIATGEFTNAYPILHTFIEILCLKIRASPSTIGILQILVFCIMWMIICKYHRDDTAKSSDEFVFQFIVTLIISLIPINAIYSITLSSNILFSYSLMFLCFLIKVMLDKNGQIDDKIAILIALTIAIISGLSTYGLYLALILLVLFVVYLYKKSNSENTIIKLSVITLAGILLILSLNFVLDVSDDTGSFPMNDAFEEGVDLGGARSQFFSNIGEKPVRGYENVVSTNLGNSKYNLVDSFANMFRQNFILDGLFNNPILYLLFSIILLGIIFRITNEKETFLILMPILLNNIIIIFNGNLYSNLLVFYLITIIFISLWFKLNLSPQDITTLAITKSDDVKSVLPNQQETKEVETNEPQHQSYENNSSSIESELEELSLDEINELLGELEQETVETENPIPKEKSTPIMDTSQEGDNDLIDEILREIEMEKK